MAKKCNGAGDNGDHCCWLKGEVCPYLTKVEGVPRCRLRLELGSWDEVHKDPRYLKDVKSVFIEVGTPVDCGDFGNNPPSCCFRE